MSTQTWIVFFAFLYIPCWTIQPPPLVPHQNAYREVCRWSTVSSSWAQARLKCVWLKGETLWRAGQNIVTTFPQKYIAFIHQSYGWLLVRQGWSNLQQFPEILSLTFSSLGNSIISLSMDMSPQWFMQLSPPSRALVAEVESETCE